MIRQSAFIWGASGHARVVADAAMGEQQLELVGFLDELQPQRRGDEMLGLPVLGGTDQLEGLRASGVKHVVLGIGDCAVRLRVAARAMELGFVLATVVHPRACIAREVSLGPGCVVMAGAVLQTGTRTGTAVVVNTGASVDHDCRLADGVHVAPGARLAGNVVVGDQTWLGIGCSLVQGVRIGARSMVGAGAVVISDLPDDVVAFGVPAKVARRREP